MQMDLEEWEFLSEDGLIDQVSPRDRRHPCGDGGGGGRRVISRENLSFYPNSIIDVDYFQRFIDPQNKKRRNDDRIAPIPVQFDHPEVVSPRAPIDEDDSAEVVKEVISSDRGDLLLPKNPSPCYNGVKGSEEETVSQVFFKKMTENEFGDMKLDSPKSTNRGFIPQINLCKPRFDEKEGGSGGLGFDCEERNGRRTPRAAAVVDGEGGFAGGFKEDFADLGEKEWGNGSGGSSDGGSNVGLSIWKMGMTGIGALCSFGFVACATMCIVVLGDSRRSRVKQQQDQKLHFQIYTTDDNRRIKPVVHSAANLNEVISAVRGAGAPPNRAQTTVGGHFDRSLIAESEAFKSMSI